MAALKVQTRKVQEIIVVNNASDDGTDQWLAGQEGLTVIRQENTGSSGGQYTGIKTAFEKGHDWFWSMDDDTVPQPDSLERMTEKPYFREPWTGFLASVVIWTDGTPHRMNTHAATDAHEWLRTVLVDRCVRATTASFVSIMFSRPAVEQVGLPIKEMFLWFDDVEYTARIARKFKNFFVLDSVAVHKTKSNAGAAFERVAPADRIKYLYGLRNYILYVKWDTVSWLRKAISILATLGRATRMAVLGRAPMSAPLWVVRGIFWYPRIEYLRST